MRRQRSLKVAQRNAALFQHIAALKAGHPFVADAGARAAGAAKPAPESHADADAQQATPYCAESEGSDTN